jgi:hypothetical protein
MTKYAYQDQDCDGEGISYESESSDCRNEHSLKWSNFVYSNLALAKTFYFSVAVLTLHTVILHKKHCNL